MKRKRVILVRNKSKSFNKDKWTVFMGTFAILLFSVVTVLVVRAYLTARSEEKLNEFAPMTYTDTEIVEPQKEFSLTGGATTIAKSATVSNPAGSQKKPVFVRVAVVCSVYDLSGVNVSYKHNCQASFTTASGWTKGADGYYYYNSIIDPGESTTELFGSDVSISNTADLPDGYTINIDVIADTVQAVSIDSSKWTADDYTASEVSTAWGIAPTLNGKTVTW